MLIQSQRKISEDPMLTQDLSIFWQHHLIHQNLFDEELVFSKVRRQIIIIGWFSTERSPAGTKNLDRWWIMMTFNSRMFKQSQAIVGRFFFQFFVRFKLFSWLLLQALKFMVNFRRPSSVEPIVINPNARIKRHRVRLLLRCTTNCCWHGFESLRWLGIWPAFNSCTLWMKFNAIVSLRSNLP